MKCNVFHASHSTTADRQQEQRLCPPQSRTLLPNQHAVHSRNLVLLCTYVTVTEELHRSFTFKTNFCALRNLWFELFINRYILPHKRPAYSFNYVKATHQLRSLNSTKFEMTWEWNETEDRVTTQASTCLLPERLMCLQEVTLCLLAKNTTICSQSGDSREIKMA
jgi:hypothetical protein